MEKKRYLSPEWILWGACVCVLISVLVGGDVLFTHYLYPVLVPLVVLEICSWAQPRRYFLAGVSVVLALTLLGYLSINWFAQQPEGFLVVGHLMSLPGLILGAVFFAKKDRTTNGGPYQSLGYGILSAGTGFLVAQILFLALLYR